MTQKIELRAKRPKHKELVEHYYDIPEGRKLLEKVTENLTRRGYSITVTLKENVVL